MWAFVTAAVLAAGLTGSKVCSDAGGDAAVAAGLTSLEVCSGAGGDAVCAAGLTGSEVCSDARGDAACPDEAVAARCAPRPGVSTTTGLWTAAVEMSGAVEGVSANGGLAAASAESPSVP